MIDEEYLLRRFYKVFGGEQEGGYYWFNIEKYDELASGYDFDPGILRTKIELICDSKTKIPSKKTISRIKGLFDGFKESETKKGIKIMKDKSISIDTIKLLGKALCDGDEYGLLIKIEPSTILDAMEEVDRVWGKEKLSDDERFLTAARIFYENARELYEEDVRKRNEARNKKKMEEEE